MPTRTRPASAALGLTLLLSLGACATEDSPARGAPAHAPATAAVTADTVALLADLDLAGLSGEEIVEELERSTQERPLAFTASVREDHLLIGDGTQEGAVPLPRDKFYVSVAPYVEQTHECYYHSLTSCQGELADEEVSVLVRDGGGRTLVDETVTTGANGFTGFWLPRGIEGGTIDITHDGHEGRAPLDTTPGSPTCLTTLRLEPVGT